MIKPSIVALAVLASTVAYAQAPKPPADLTTPPQDSQLLAPGLTTLSLQGGTGTTKPPADGYVKLRYTIWRNDGKLMDHVPSDRASLLPVARMMPGWRTVVLDMVTGDRRRTWMSADHGDGKIPQGTSLIIDTELVDIVDGPKTPVDLKSAPADAVVTKSGLASKVLREGSGTKSPTRRNKVRVHYSGWTTEGRLFDSSVLRGTPAEFGLNQVIAGWTEGLQLMKEGEIRRFWIPAKLAYAGDASKPQGMLVFDIELIAVK